MSELALSSILASSLSPTETGCAVHRSITCLLTRGEAFGLRFITRGSHAAFLNVADDQRWEMTATTQGC